MSDLASYVLEGLFKDNIDKIISGLSRHKPRNRVAWFCLLAVLEGVREEWDWISFNCASQHNRSDANPNRAKDSDNYSRCSVRECERGFGRVNRGLYIFISRRVSIIRADVPATSDRVTSSTWKLLVRLRRSVSHSPLIRMFNLNEVGIKPLTSDFDGNCCVLKNIKIPCHSINLLTPVKVQCPPKFSWRRRLWQG